MSSCTIGGFSRRAQFHKVSLVSRETMLKALFINNKFWRNISKLALKIFKIFFCEKVNVSQIFRLNTSVALPQILGNLIYLIGNLLKQKVRVLSRFFLI
jgi:hypothetical protein